MKKNVTSLTHAAVIAALYVVLTFLSNAFGLASGAIQVRFSEALCILPFFTPVAIPGLFIGCIISNLLTGAVIWDVIFGSLATLIGAYVTYLLRKWKWCAPLGAILANGLIIPFVLYFAYGLGPIWLFFITVTAGEVISCGVFGMMLLFALEKYRHQLFS